MKPPEPLFNRIARVEELTTARSCSPLLVKTPEAVPTTLESDGEPEIEKSPAPLLAMIWAVPVPEARAKSWMYD